MAVLLKWVVSHNRRGVPAAEEPKKLGLSVWICRFGRSSKRQPTDLVSGSLILIT